jgi:hypothetical protein
VSGVRSCHHSDPLSRGCPLSRANAPVTFRHTPGASAHTVRHTPHTCNQAQIEHATERQRLRRTQEQAGLHLARRGGLQQAHESHEAKQEPKRKAERKVTSVALAARAEDAAPRCASRVAAAVRRQRAELGLQLRLER